ncbi:hypothetical protein CNMCM8927_002918 [Aspergillus lentulus]|uniref:Formylmethionine deformylase-like protein n=1 Tax=Aspergillus lentulus TaxID=293939 RepID=A0AAN5YT90_ASPLE|nr:hypothetical protein CNMCM8060_004270 [Aspergillus lentulus]KAF4196935.1 hypothetical protein CNMCM8694_004195 [Aspergillus lentulus]KAF4207513.1 hypothetical protein CNMCM8927_002918 [Aspergillus lentulus]
MSPPTYDHYADCDPVPDKRPQSPVPAPVPVPVSVQETETPAAWGVGWRCPGLMVGLVISGAMLSMGHHLYYESLDGRRVASREQQTWAIRIGTGFAFLIKSCLVSAVGLAAVQETWATLRRKSVRLSGIDSMFAVRDSPLAFLTLDLWLYAKTLTVLAIVAWLIPLTAIVTPATLNVVTYPARDKIERLVPNVNFDPSFWRNEAQFDEMWHITSPSASIARVFTTLASSAQVLPVSAPFSNSSYELSFWGPSYKCQRLSEALVEIDGVTQKLWDSEIPEPQFQTTRLYMGTAPSALNNTVFISAAGSNPLWNDNATQPTEFVCQLWNTSYVVNMHFTNGIQTLTPISVDHIAYANWNRTDAISSAAPSYSGLDPTVNAGFYIMQMILSGLLQGELVQSKRAGVYQNKTVASGTTYTDTSLAYTGLFACPELWNTSSHYYKYGNDITTTSCRNGTLAQAIEDLSHNFTYSLLSLNGGNTTVKVTDLTYRNYYFYGRTALLGAYMCALAVTIACVVVGFFSLRRNGVSQNNSFSSVLMTTRNPELDRLAVGHCLGSEPLKGDIDKVRLQFGEVEGANLRHRHAAFGSKGSVTALSKGEEYY